VTARCTVDNMYNIALNKTAKQVSRYAHKVASRAVDGRHDTASCTDAHIHPWWAVDLGATYHVGRVIVTNDFKVNGKFR